VDIATRVIADHTRAVAFSIADGQLPSNNKAGYVIRRILRRAVRYAYTYLGQEEPFMYRLVDILTINMGEAYPGLKAQHDLIKKVIQEEEVSFLKTLSTGIKLLDELKEKAIKDEGKTIAGKDAFVLYDTYGFPLDLTELISRESGLKVDTSGFQDEMQKQKSRSKSAAKVETSDWTVLKENEKEEFTGYDDTESEINITRYRKIQAKGKELYHLVFDHTPFYAESGGQIGDTGTLHQNGESIKIVNTIKENNLHIHVATELPPYPEKPFTARVNPARRSDTAANHTATHLLHHALKKVLGPHVEQKGSLVHPDYLRFDFSHFQKVTDGEIEKIEAIVNGKIRENIPLKELRSVPMEKARELGAVALFGEKYGDNVRVIQFDESIELCGGTHVHATGGIGFFKIISEGAIAAGIRRIEALTGKKSHDFVNEKLHQLQQLGVILKNPNEIVKATEQVIEENARLKKQIETFEKEKVGELKSNLANKKTNIKGINFIGEVLEVDNAGILKDLAFKVKDKVDNLFMIVGAEINGKANLSIMISKELVEQKKLHAGSIIKDVARNIQGGGGGQPFFATAGGKNPAGLQDAINQARNIVEEIE
jgi:alanyl-tRNA synthetase